MASSASATTRAFIRIRNQRDTLGRQLLPAVAVLFMSSLTLLGAVLIGVTNLGVFVVAGVLAVIITFAITVRPTVGLYLLISFVYLNFSNVLEVAFDIPSINKPLVALVFVGVLANRFVLHHKPLIFRTAEVSLLLYGVSIAISTFTAQITDVAMDNLIDWIKDFAILIIVVQLASDERTWKRMNWVIIFSAAFLSLLTAYQMISGDTENTFYGLANAPVHEISAGFDSTRPTGPIEDPNFYAQMLMMVLPMAAYRMMSERGYWTRLAGLTSFALILAAIIFTYSRGGFLGLLVVGILIIHERKLNPYKIAFIVFTLVLAVAPFLPAGYLDRVLTITNIFSSSDSEDSGVYSDSSFTGRSSEMIVAVDMFMDYPLYGIGVLNYPEHYIEYSSRVGLDQRLEKREPHSLYLEAAAERGLIGIFTLAFLLFTVFREMYRARHIFLRIGRDDLAAWVVSIQFGLIGFLVTSIFLHGAYIRYFWLIIGSAISSSVVAQAMLDKYLRERDRKRADEQERRFIVVRELTLSPAQSLRAVAQKGHPLTSPPTPRALPRPRQDQG